MGIGLYWLMLERKRAGRPTPARDRASDLAPAPADVPATATDTAMMERALCLADRAAAKGEVPVGAVVYRIADGRVLGEGFNRRERDRDPSAHAEFIAILAAAKKLGDWRLNNCAVAVTLEPCAMCAGLIVNARVGRVVYGAADPKAGAVRTLLRVADDPRLNHRAAIVPGVLRVACSRRLTEFFTRLRAGRSRNPPAAGEVRPRRGRARTRRARG